MVAGENDDGAFGITGEFGERDGCAVNIFQREVTRFVTDFIPGLRGKYDEYQHEGSEELFHGCYGLSYDAGSG